METKGYITLKYIYFPAATVRAGDIGSNRQFGEAYAKRIGSAVSGAEDEQPLLLSLRDRNCEQARPSAAAGGGSSPFSESIPLAPTAGIIPHHSGEG